MIRFAAAEIDVPARTVVHDGAPRHLEPQAFDLLVYLIDHRDRVVPKAELLDEVWGDQFVSESALTTRIKQIRQALGDDGARQAVVQNVRGRGYRFVAELDQIGAAPAVAQSELLGRDSDVPAVIGLLDEVRCVTLTGPGGVGKTTLAREVCRHVGERLSGQIHVVRLADVREPSDVVHALRRATGLVDAGDGEDDLLAAVSLLEGVVAIDNCEHLIDEVARIVDAIVQRPGQVRILATSRERLGVAGERVWPVAPLDHDDARALLVARARAARPDVELADRDHMRVERLLGMLDRLPLAIEMAAARLASVGIADLVEHLSERLDLLRTPHRGSDDRHRTLAELVEWSERLLDDDARLLLADLTVFAGSMRLDDIAGVVERDPTELALGPLAELVERSLLVAEVGDETQYRLLETVRSVVAPRRRPDIDERHARHVTAEVRVADRMLRTAREADAVRRIDGLEADIRVAHRWARRHDLRLAAELTTGLLRYALERQWSEPASWCIGLAEATDDGAGGPPEVDRSAFAAALAADHANRGEYERAMELARQALEGDDMLVQACAHDALSNIGLYLGDRDAAMHHGIELLRLGEELNDVPVATLGVVCLTLAPLYSGDVEGARVEFETHRPADPVSPSIRAWLAYTEGELLTLEGRPREAIARFDEAVDVGESIGGTFVVNVSQVSRLAALARAGEIDAAMGAFAAVLARYRRVQSMTHAITALRNLVWLLVRAERDRPAIELLGALCADDVKTTYGVESELLAEARATVESRRSVDDVNAWFEFGTRHDPRWALERAVEVLSE